MPSGPLEVPLVISKMTERVAGEKSVLERRKVARPTGSSERTCTVNNGRFVVAPVQGSMSTADMRILAEESVLNATALVSPSSVFGAP